jgi:hypothetical protein
MRHIILALLIGLLSWKALVHYRSSRTPVAETMPLASLPEAPLEAQRPAEREAVAGSDYRCDGRTMCSQMRSCPEATYFLQNCPGVKMDGDHDGIPCERQWCQ